VSAVTTRAKKRTKKQ